MHPYLSWESFLSANTTQIKEGLKYNKEEFSPLGLAIPRSTREVDRVTAFAQQNRQKASLMCRPDITEQLKMEHFSTTYKGMNSGAKGWCQILSCTWCISRDLAGALTKTEHVFVHIQHPLRDSLLKLLLRLCLAPEVFSQENTTHSWWRSGRDSGGLHRWGFDPRKCSG